MENEIILVTENNGFVTLTINRPQALNAINAEVMDAIYDYFTNNQGNRMIKGIIITGAGEKAFAAGADIKAFASLDKKEGSALSKKGHDTYFLIERFHVPVIAAVNGFALGGGCELAMACHMRIASSNARFGQPEVNLGLIPGYGGSQRLIQYIGKGKALELLITGDMIDADDAHRLGLVNYVTEPGQALIDKCHALLQKIAEKGPLAIEKIIQIVNLHFDNEPAFRNEYESFGELIESHDSKEGAEAFVSKRKPVFKGQ